MKALRAAYGKRKGKLWSNANVSIENFQFKVEYGFEDLNKSEYDSYERHVIWRYKYLKIDLDASSKKDKNIIQRYLQDVHLHGELKKDLYIEGIYKVAMKNIVDFEKTLTVDEAIAQSKPEVQKKPRNLLKKKQLVEEEEDEHINNQILNFGNKPIKRD